MSNLDQAQDQGRITWGLHSSSNDTDSLGLDEEGVGTSTTADTELQGRHFERMNILLLGEDDTMACNDAINQSYGAEVLMIMSRS